MNKFNFFLFPIKTISFINFTTTTQIIIKKLAKKKRRRQVLSFRDRPIVLTISHSNSVRRRKYRKQANKIKRTRK